MQYLIVRCHSLMNYLLHRISPVARGKISNNLKERLELKKKTHNLSLLYNNIINHEQRNQRIYC